MFIYTNSNELSWKRGWCTERWWFFSLRTVGVQPSIALKAAIYALRSQPWLTRVAHTQISWHTISLLGDIILPDFIPWQISAYVSRWGGEGQEVAPGKLQSAAPRGWQYPMSGPSCPVLAAMGVCSRHELKPACGNAGILQCCLVGAHHDHWIQSCERGWPGLRALALVWCTVLLWRAALRFTSEYITLIHALSAIRAEGASALLPTQMSKSLHTLGLRS